MVNYKKLLFFFILGGGLWAGPVCAQSALQQAQNHLHQKHPHLAQQPELGWVVTDEIPNPRLGVVHLYVRQTFQGLEIKNANLNFTLQQGQVKQMSGTFVQKVSPRGLLKNPGLSEAQALLQAAQQLGLSGSVPSQRQTTPTKGTIFEGGQLSQDDIPIRLVYWALPDQSLRLAWEMQIHEHSGQNWWDLCVDAQTGQIIAKQNWVTKCQFDHAHAQDCHTRATHRLKTSEPMGIYETTQYNVYSYPLESPNHGDRSLVTSPFNPLASPFGWHDTNGQTGAEHTIARGNNVHAYEDRNNDNQPGYSPNGGAGLIFDFPFDQEASPLDNQDAVITNLFYWNNFIHDVFHFYGFDEMSGNFQVNNYGGLGAGNDDVRAEAQDGSGLNNANFGTPPDGSRPRMQMFLWNTSGGGFILTVNTPANIAGDYTATGASFGPLFLVEPISGAVVLAQPNLACEPFTNASAINGKIALVDRGECTFVEKVLNAQNAGAIAVIVVNNQAGAPINLGGTEPAITIPSIMVSQSDGQLLKNNIASLQVTLTDDRNYFDSSLDNGIIVHEYGHGISNRLTGGPANTGCLGNLEQMGEGWSDYFALVLTMKPGDVGTMPRGIGTFAINQPTAGGGIRPAPYTTDLSINPYTYANVGDGGPITVPHGVGFIWCSALWDMTWLLIDRYGFDPDMYEGEGGNNIALQLVTDGLKLQPCNPGFIDGRDAILLADQLSNGGANQDLIWEAFARRGMGADASQGSPDNLSDGVPTFSLPTAVSLRKSVDKIFVAQGQELTYTLRLKNNFAETQTDLLVEDILAEGLEVVPGSITEGGTQDGNTVNFAIKTLSAQEEKVLQFKALLNTSNFNDLPFWDNHEAVNALWQVAGNNASNGWRRNSDLPNSGLFAWFVPNPGFAGEHSLIMTQALQPTSQSQLVFYHYYNTEASWDGGVIEVSANNGSTWSDLGSAILENGYVGPIDGASGTSLAGKAAFHGRSNGYVRTVVDLSGFNGQSIRIRFRFVSDIAIGGEGWYIDDILMSEGTASGIPNEACVSGGSLPEPICAQSAAVFALSCTPDAGDLVPPLGLPLPLTGCPEEDTELFSFTASYAANDETNPGLGYDYYFVMTTVEAPHTLVAVSNSGQFDLTNILPGTYQVWGISYSRTNAVSGAEAYITQLFTNERANIEAIQADINENGLCADVSNQMADGSILTVTRTTCTALPPAAQAAGLSLFPNPSPQDLFLKIVGQNGKPGKIELISPLGQKTWEKDFQVAGESFIQQLSLAHLPRGVYLVRIYLGEESFTGRVVLQ